MELQIIQKRIFEIRGQRVMLDSHLAELYEVETRVLNQAVSRNNTRFPEDFMFQLTENEYEILSSQIVIAKKDNRGGRRSLPYVFTEQGVAMLSGVLNSDKAIAVNIAIMRTFVMIRQVALSYKDLADKIEALESTSDRRFKDVYEALDLLFEDKKFNNRNKIGF